MGIEKMVNDLYKFLKTDVSDKSLFEATNTAYKSDVQYLKESKLPEDPSQIKDPTGDVQKLSEEKKEDKKSAGDVKPAEMTDEVALSKVEKDADKKTPDVDKLSDAQAVVKDAEKVKEARKAAFLKKVKEARKVKEGKLPADLSQVKQPTEEIYQLAENEVEAPLTTLPDEEAAKRVVNKVGTGKSRYEKNQKGQFIVYTKEAKVKECDVKVTDVKVVGAKNPKDVIKKQQESKIKEETTTEMPGGGAAEKVPEVDAKTDVNVDVSPIVNANPDNKDSEKAVAGEVNNDADADKIANANPDNKDKAGIVKEDATTEPTKGEVKAATKVPEVDAETKTDVDAGAISNANPDNKDKKQVAGEVNTSTSPADKAAKANPDNKDKEGIVAEKKGKVKEEVDVVVTADGKGVTVTQDDSGATTVTTNPTPSAEVTADVANVGHEMGETPEEEAAEHAAEEVFDGEDELVPEELEVAEKLFLADYLKSKKQLSEKETKFIKETRSIKLSKKAWERVHKKVATLKGKK